MSIAADKSGASKGNDASLQPTLQPVTSNRAIRRLAVIGLGTALIVAWSRKNSPSSSHPTVHDADSSGWLRSIGVLRGKGYSTGNGPDEKAPNGNGNKQSAMGNEANPISSRTFARNNRAGGTDEPKRPSPLMPQNGTRRGLYANMNTNENLQGVEHNHIEASIDQVASELKDVLSGRLTAYVAGVDDGYRVRSWALGRVADIEGKTARRLRTAYDIVQLITAYETPKVARAWFVGSNPFLDKIAPATAIRNDHLDEAIGAACAFVAGVYA